MQLKGGILTSGEFSEQYTEAMKKELTALIHQNTWKTVPHSEYDNLIKSTWAFKLKQHETPGSSKQDFMLR